MSRRINHIRRVLDKKVISVSELIPGMIISLRYNSKNRFDPNPLGLYLYRDKKFNLMHFLNFNYIHESDLQNLFKNISKKVDIFIDYDVSEKGYTRINLNKNPKSKTGVGAKVLYETIIKPKLFNVSRTKDCYRTFKIDKISSLRLINYRMDVIEERIRKDANISKHRLKTAELFENIEEQNVEITTKNIRVEKQDNIRKDIKE
jgi:hypothetical protein